jgi:cytochrome c oxidase subunit II
MVKPVTKPNLFLRVSFLLTSSSLLIVSGCEGRSSVLDPDGPGARQIADLWWLLFGIATVVYIFVVGLLVAALFRRRQSADATPITTDAPPRGAHTFIVMSGAIVPAFILTGVFVYTLTTWSALSPNDANDVLNIRVIGHQFWWEVRYPDHDFVTANEIRIPANTPVRVEVSSADVIHSFWVPELNGKIDLIPGRTNTVWLQADTPGEYRGQCGEFCGVQHAHMAFLVIAESPDDFAAWVARQQMPAPEPATDTIREGREVFLSASCVYCHAIRGTNASSPLGPDLTHLASRRTIGAGTLANNRGNLAGWIVNAHSSKPGNRMPPMTLEGEDLQLLLAYLQTLE